MPLWSRGWGYSWVSMASCKRGHVARCSCWTFRSNTKNSRRVCGIKTESLSWLEPWRLCITKRLKSYIEQPLPLLPIKHISQLTSVHWHNTIKEIDKRRLRRVVPSVKWEGLRQLVMDEFAIFEAHRYATVIADAKTHQVIWYQARPRHTTVLRAVRQAWQ